LPLAAWAMGEAVVALSAGRTGRAAALTAACLAGNLFFVLPVRLAAGSPEPGGTVSSLMREKLRDVPLRSDLLAFLGELGRGASGYVEPVAALIGREGAPGQTAYSDSDNLSYMFATPLRFMTPGELDAAAPDWILPSPWLRFDPAALARVRALLAGGGYRAIDVPAPRLSWQANPDILFHVFRPEEGTRSVYKKL
jgi:hypothetical protein